ncbi:hypothetical protein M3B43_11465, partial [Nesterenkonia massiliensis]
MLLFLASGTQEAQATSAASETARFSLTQGSRQELGPLDSGWHCFWRGKFPILGVICGFVRVLSSQDKTRIGLLDNFGDVGISVAAMMYGITAIGSALVFIRWLWQGRPRNPGAKFRAFTT